MLLAALGTVEVSTELCAVKDGHANGVRLGKHQICRNMIPFIIDAIVTLARDGVAFKHSLVLTRNLCSIHIQSRPHPNGLMALVLTDNRDPVMEGHKKVITNNALQLPFQSNAVSDRRFR